MDAAALLWRMQARKAQLLRDKLAATFGPRPAIASAPPAVVVAPPSSRGPAPSSRARREAAMRLLQFAVPTEVMWTIRERLPDLPSWEHPHGDDSRTATLGDVFVTSHLTAEEAVPLQTALRGVQGALELDRTSDYVFGLTTSGPDDDAFGTRPIALRHDGRRLVAVRRARVDQQTARYDNFEIIDGPRVAPASARPVELGPVAPASARASSRRPVEPPAPSSARPSSRRPARAIPASVQRALGAVEALVANHGLLAREELQGPLADLRSYGAGELLREAVAGVQRRPGLRAHLAALEALSLTLPFRRHGAEGNALDALREALRAAQADLYLALNENGAHLGIEEQARARRAPDEAAAAALELVERAEEQLRRPAPPQGPPPSSRRGAEATVIGDMAAPFPPKHRALELPHGARAWEDGEWVKVSFRNRPTSGSAEMRVMEALKEYPSFRWYGIEKAWSQRVSDAARRKLRTALLLLGDGARAALGAASAPGAPASERGPSAAVICTAAQAAYRIASTFKDAGVDYAYVERPHGQAWNWKVRASHVATTGSGRHAHQNYGVFEVKIEGGVGLGALYVRLEDQKTLARDILERAIGGVRVLSKAEEEAGVQPTVALPQHRMHVYRAYLADYEEAFARVQASWGGSYPESERKRLEQDSATKRERVEKLEVELFGGTASAQRAAGAAPITQHLSRPETAERIRVALRTKLHGAPGVKVVSHDDGRLGVVVSSIITRRRKQKELVWGVISLGRSGGVGLGALVIRLSKDEVRTRQILDELMRGVSVDPAPGYEHGRSTLAEAEVAEPDKDEREDEDEKAEPAQAVERFDAPAPAPAQVAAQAASIAPGSLRTQYRLDQGRLEGAQIQLAKSIGGGNPIAIFHGRGPQPSLDLVTGESSRAAMIMDYDSPRRDELILFAALAAQQGSLQARADFDAVRDSLRSFDHIRNNLPVSERFASDAERPLLPPALADQIRRAEAVENFDFEAAAAAADEAPARMSVAARQRRRDEIAASARALRWGGEKIRVLALDGLDAWRELHRPSAP